MIIVGLFILLVAAVMFFPLIKKKPKNETSKLEQKLQQKENIHEPLDSGAQVIINIKNYHEAKNELPHIRCEHCGNKNKSDARKCQDCGATL